ncbi:MAG: hypothetical protein MZV63_16585 [Marinilabiliales bacterium]|nr:hypothetical protein [Marinilabiliales bacterium]
MSLGLDKVVFVKSDGGFKAHKRIQHRYRTRESARAGNFEWPAAMDSVAVNAQYLMDSESFIKIKP